MFVAEEKLTVQIAQIDGIEVNDMYFSKAGQQKVFEQLAADTAGTNKKHTRLSWKRGRRQHQALFNGREYKRIAKVRVGCDIATSLMRLESVPRERFR